MPIYHFDLSGEIRAHDVPGHPCADDQEAREHARFIAHRIVTERPEMVGDGNSIIVRNEKNEEILKVDLSSP